MVKYDNGWNYYNGIVFKGFIEGIPTSYKQYGFDDIPLLINLTAMLIGFGIGTLKVPEIAKFEFSKKTGGENIDDIIKRAIMFKMKGKKLYVYKEGKSDE